MEEAMEVLSSGEPALAFYIHTRVSPFNQGALFRDQYPEIKVVEQHKMSPDFYSRGVCQFYRAVVRLSSAVGMEMCLVTFCYVNWCKIVTSYQHSHFIYTSIHTRLYIHSGFFCLVNLSHYQPVDRPPTLSCMILYATTCGIMCLILHPFLQHLACKPTFAHATTCGH